jgi:hypothetical protein
MISIACFAYAIWQYKLPPCPSPKKKSMFSHSLSPKVLIGKEIGTSVREKSQDLNMLKYDNGILFYIVKGPEMCCLGPINS